MHPGKWVKQKRQRAGFGMRQFAILIGEQPSNWCNVENERRDIPKKEEKLRKIAQVLGIRENSEEWDVLMGFVSKPVMLPADLGNAIGIEHVPNLLRTIGEKRLTGEEVRKIIRYVKKNFKKEDSE